MHKQPTDQWCWCVCTDVLCQWEKLHALASDRHQQAHQLKVVEDAIKTMKGVVLAAQQCLSFELFTSKEELEATITTLRVSDQFITMLAAVDRLPDGALFVGDD